MSSAVNSVSMSHNHGLREAPGNKEKISKWKLYKNQIKLLKESTKADAPSNKVGMRTVLRPDPSLV